MAVHYEGQGTTFTRAGLTLAPKTITMPGWSRTMIDITNLGNAAFKTKVVATLKETKEIVLTLEFDPAVYGALSASEDNATTVIDFCGSTECITLWSAISDISDVSLETDTQPTFDLTLTVTNLNGSSVETGPVYAAS